MAAKCTYRLLEVGDEVVAIFILFETGERHLRTGDVLQDVQVGDGVDLTWQRYTPFWGSRGTRRGSARPR